MVNYSSFCFSAITCTLLLLGITFISTTLAFTTTPNHIFHKLNNNNNNNKYAISSPSSSSSSPSSSSLMIGQIFDFVSGKKKNTASTSKDNSAKIIDLKNQIRSLAEGTDNGISASDTTREKISELVTELETLNPTKKLSSDEKLNGSWTLLYTTNDGSSAGKLGPFVGDVEQLIQLQQPEGEEDSYINYVRVGPLEGALTATRDNLADNKWQVNFQTLKFSLFNIQLINTKLEAQGIWRKTYLDDDFRILYAIGGKNTVKENIYILAK